MWNKVEIFRRVSDGSSFFVHPRVPIIPSGTRVPFGVSKGINSFTIHSHSH